MKKILCYESELNAVLTALVKQGCQVNKFSEQEGSILEDWRNNRGATMFAWGFDTTMVNPRTNKPERVYKVHWTPSFDKAMGRNTDAGEKRVGEPGELDKVLNFHNKH